MKEVYERFDFSAIVPRQNFTFEETRNMVVCKLITKNGNGKINPYIYHKQFVDNNVLILLESVWYHTLFLDADAKYVLRIACIFNNIKSYPKCKVCGKSVKRLTNISNFRKMFFGEYCSYACNAFLHNPKSNLTKEQYAKVLEKTSKTRKERYHSLPQEWKDKLSLAAQSEKTKKKKGDTNYKRYGVRNPGVLGAYHSKAACKFIGNFIAERKIDPLRCFFHDVHGKREFFQNIVLGNNKKRFVSYDLVVFKNIESAIKKDLQQIEIVLEYNGSWHYTKDEILGHENEPAVPYTKNNTYTLTKQEVYDIDNAKLKHMLQFTKNVFVFSEKTKKMIQYDGNNL